MAKMEKAYDFKELGMRLKAAGLVEVEDAAEKFYEIFKAWAKESAAITPMPYDDMVISFIPQADTVVNPVIDQIDGQKG